mmetsp:Transcript_5869/g.18688  ORF Transcript_5869/g.18688 Transcript_5869/m.18688 type:complete len:246 (+) Transcript_5869:1132-1869(+)
MVRLPTAQIAQTMSQDRIIHLIPLLSHRASQQICVLPRPLPHHVPPTRRTRSLSRCSRPVPAHRRAVAQQRHQLLSPLGVGCTSTHTRAGPASGWRRHRLLLHNCDPELHLQFLQQRRVCLCFLHQPNRRLLRHDLRQPPHQLLARQAGVHRAAPQRRRRPSSTAWHARWRVCHVLVLHHGERRSLSPLLNLLRTSPMPPIARTGTLTRTLALSLDARRSSRHCGRPNARSHSRARGRGGCRLCA